MSRAPAGQELTHLRELLDGLAVRLEILRGRLAELEGERQVEPLSDEDWADRNEDEAKEDYEQWADL